MIKYYYWPSLACAFYAAPMPVKRFIDTHILQGNVSLLKRGAFACISYVPCAWKWFAQPIWLTQKCDVILCSNVPVIIDFSERKVRKYYPPTPPDYLKTALDAGIFSLLPIKITHTTYGMCFEESLYDATPLSSTPTLDWPTRTHYYQLALHSMATLPSTTSHVATADYVHTLLGPLHAKHITLHEYVTRLIDVILHDYKNYPISLTLSHGDFKDENILIKDNSVHLIDWELAGIRSVGHDVANLLIHPLVVRAQTPFAEHSEIKNFLVTQLAVPDDNHLRHAVMIAMLEKYCMYFGTERWSNVQETTLEHWCYMYSTIAGILEIEPLS